MAESMMERGGRRDRLVRRSGGAVLLLGVLALGAANSVSCVRTGHVGVVTVFGRVTGRTMGEGIHLVNPVARVHQLDIKTQEIKERASVPSREGLIMGLEASVLYHLDPAGAADGLSEDRAELRGGAAGPEFPLVDAGRDGGEHRERALLGLARERSRGRSSTELRAQVQPRGVVVENVLLRDLQLPETLKHAIEAKQQAQQDAQRMEFVLQKETPGSGAQARRGSRHQGLPGHRLAGHQRQAARSGRASRRRSSWPAAPTRR